MTGSIIRQVLANIIFVVLLFYLFGSVHFANLQVWQLHLTGVFYASQEASNKKFGIFNSKIPQLINLPKLIIKKLGLNYLFDCFTYTAVGIINLIPHEFVRWNVKVFNQHWHWHGYWPRHQLRVYIDKQTNKYTDNQTNKQT